MRTLIYSDQSQQDIADILTYIALQSASVAIASRFRQELLTRCEKLASLPGTLGRARPELGHDLRSMAHKSYVILFRYRDDAVEIVTIVHGHRDIDSHFGEE